MALFVDLPPQLLDYRPVWNVLIGCDTREALEFRLTCFGRACQAGRPVLGQLVPRAAFEELVDLLRAVRAWPVRPDSRIDVLPLEIQAVEQFDHASYTWRWLVLGVSWVCDDTQERHASIPFSVACLAPGNLVGGFQHVLSLSAIWHLVPTRVSIAQVVSQRPFNAPFWASMLALGVSADNVLCSNKAWSKQQPADVASRNLQFNQFMCTTLAAIVIIALKVNAKTQKSDMLTVMASLLTELCKACLRGRFRIVFPEQTLSVQDGNVPCSQVVTLLLAWDKLAAWSDQVVRMPALHGDTMPLASFLWYVFRTSNLERTQLAAVRQLCHTVAAQCSKTLPNVLHHTTPALALPRDCYGDMRLALRGDDKRLLMFNKFLARRTGFASANAEDDILLKDPVLTSNLNIFGLQFLTQPHWDRGTKESAALRHRHNWKNGVILSEWPHLLMC